MLRSTSGGALVELAVVASILVTILLGASEFAMLAYDNIEVTDAAHAALSYAAQSVANAGNSAAVQAVATSSANDVSGITATPHILYSCSSTPSTLTSTTPSCTSGDSVLTYVRVNTTATVTMPIHLPGLTSYSLSAQPIMRIIQ